MKLLVVISVAVVVCIFATAAFASNPIKLFVNGNEIVSDIPPQIVLVFLRSFFQHPYHSHCPPGTRPTHRF